MIPACSSSPDPDPVTAFICLKDHILIWEEGELSALRVIKQNRIVWVVVSNPTTKNTLSREQGLKYQILLSRGKGPIDQLLFRNHSFLLFNPFSAPKSSLHCSFSKRLPLTAVLWSNKQVFFLGKWGWYPCLQGGLWWKHHCLERGLGPQSCSISGRHLFEHIAQGCSYRPQVQPDVIFISPTAMPSSVEPL